MASNDHPINTMQYICREKDESKEIMLINIFNINKISEIMLRNDFESAIPRYYSKQLTSVIISELNFFGEALYTEKLKNILTPLGDGLHKPKQKKITCEHMSQNS